MKVISANSEGSLSSQKEVATLAGGCFWCLEAVFLELNGVLRVVPGYCGGNMENPTYEMVRTENTGHAESVQVTFDPGTISYKELLDVFFAIHDPTTPNRQGADVGTQYRSAIFYHSQDQRKIAEKTIADLNSEGVWKSPIVTQLAPFERFYPAESYHYRYFERNPAQPYCQVVIAPKLAKFRAHFTKKLKRS